MRKKSIVYLHKAGRAECPHCLKAAAQRAAELKLRYAVVATTSGRTALELAKALRRAGSRAQVVGIAYAANYAAKWGRLKPSVVKQAARYGVAFASAGHALGGINSAIRDKFGTLTPNNLIAYTYYTIGQGFKVAVEVALMAADQELVPTDQEILALGGSGQGADTAVVLTPACSAEFFKLKVHEIVSMPRRSA